MSRKSVSMKKGYKITLLLIGILLIVSVVIGSSYAIWVYSETQEGTNSLVSDCFEITYVDSNDINLNNAYPMTNEEASNLTPYTFTIKNICNHAMNYDVNIETLQGSTLNTSYVRYKLDDKGTRILGSIADNDSSVFVNNNVLSSKTIASNILKPNEERKFDLRLWIDYNSTKEQSANKTYSGKVVITTTLNKDYKICYLVSGKEFNKRIKKVAGNIDPSENTVNTSIKEISFVELNLAEIPDDIFDQVVIISTEDSPTPAYALYDQEIGMLGIISESHTYYLNEDSSYMFANLQELTGIIDAYFIGINTVNMSHMYYNDYKMNVINLSIFNYTGNVRDMSYMFAVSNSDDKLPALYSINNIDKLNTSNVENIEGMFMGQSNLNDLNLGYFNTSRVTNMSHMFEEMDIIDSLNLGNFDTSNVTNMSGMFKNMSELNSIYIKDKWSTSSVIYGDDMFTNDTQLKGGKRTSYDSNHVDYIYARIDDPANNNPGYLSEQK